MIDLREVHPLTDFQRNAKEYVGRLKGSKTPLVLTINGRAELVVQDAVSYQALLDRLEALELEAAIEADVRAGRTRSLEQFASETGAKYGLRRKAS